MNSTHFLSAVMNCRPLPADVTKRLKMPLMRMKVSVRLKIIVTTVEPLNKGYIWTSHLFCPKQRDFPLLKMYLHCINKLSFLERLSCSQKVLYWKFHCIS